MTTPAPACHGAAAPSPRFFKHPRQARRGSICVLGLVVAVLGAGSFARAQFANDQTARVLRLDRFVLPDFPPFLRQSGMTQGTVVVALDRGELNRAGDVLVLESTDERFTDAALDAIHEWRFAANQPPAAATGEIPVVRFLFTSGSVAVVPLAIGPRTAGRRTIRADSPVELPNFSHLDAPPKALANSAPEFPAALRGRVSQGMVVVKYFVDAQGKVRLPAVVSASEPEFGLAALTAIRSWRFEPPRIDGRAVVALERHSFHFAAGEPR